MNKLAETFQKNNKTVPIWLMRQAGRYLPEYMHIRSNVDSFLDLCYDSQKASKVTLQPIERFDLDAAIIFSDILVLPHSLGWDVKFEQGEGPILKRFESENDLMSIRGNFSDKIKSVYETVSIVKSKLSPEKSLIGFAGSPWTVASYMLEGRGKQDFSVSKNFLYSDKKTSLKLIEIITEKTIEYLTGQISAGADIIQLFDSWAGVLNDELYENFVIKPTKKIVSHLNKDFPKIPIIGFPRASGFNYNTYIEKTGVNGISVDQFTPIYQMKKWQKEILVQGNLDPVVLLGDKEIIKTSVDKIMTELDQKNFIFNLGHGILPKTPIKNVEYLVNYVKSFKK